MRPVGLAWLLRRARAGLVDLGPTADPVRFLVLRGPVGKLMRWFSWSGLFVYHIGEVWPGLSNLFLQPWGV